MMKTKKYFPGLESGIWILMFILTLNACTNSDKQKSGDEKVVKADEFTRLNEDIAGNPGDASLYFRRAIVFDQRKNLKQAFEDISKAVMLDSGKATYFLLLADISFKGLQIQKAINAFKKAIELEPENKEAHLKLSELYLYLKAYPQSLAEANEALKIDKNAAKAYFIKGFAYKETADTPKAISSFQTATELQSDYYDAYIQLGNIQAARKNSIAVQYYNNALRLQPSSTEAYYNRGLAFQNMGELDKAIEDYKTILKLNIRYSEAHFNLGYIDLVFKKDYKSAIAHFTDAIRSNDLYAEAFFNRGLAYEYSGNKSAAIKDYNEALKIIPTYKLAKRKLKGM